MLSRFEMFLTEWFESDDLESKGLPSVRQCAQEMGYSTNYLSDVRTTTSQRSQRKALGKPLCALCVFVVKNMQSILSRFFVVIAVCSVLIFSGCGGKPENIGVKNERLASCPSSPNCVSSLEDEDEKHSVEPLSYTGELTDARQRLLDIIHSMKRTKIITSNERYIHAEFRSGLFHFVDDVEFYFEPESVLIQVRSASRVGHSDLGVNRKRVEAIRERYAQQ